MGQSNITELVKQDDVAGTGNEAVAGRQVSVHYTGWLYDRRAPITRDRNSTARAIATSRSRFDSARGKSSRDGIRESRG